MIDYFLWTVYQVWSLRLSMALEGRSEYTMLSSIIKTYQEGTSSFQRYMSRFGYRWCWQTIAKCSKLIFGMIDIWFLNDLVFCSVSGNFFSSGMPLSLACLLCRKQCPNKENICILLRRHLLFVYLNYSGVFAGKNVLIIVVDFLSLIPCPIPEVCWLKKTIHKMPIRQ